MIYAVIILSFAVAAVVTYGIAPYIAILVAFVIGVGTPILLCVNQALLTRLTVWQPAGAGEYVTVGIGAAFAGLYVGLVCRQLILYHQGELGENAHGEIARLKTRLTELEARVRNQ